MSDSSWPYGLQHTRLFLSSTISRTLLKLMSIESVMPSNHLILCCSLLLTSVFLSIRVFSNESALHIKWPKYWGFSFTLVLPMNIQGRFPLGLTDLMSLLSKGPSRVFSTTTVRQHESLSAHFLYGPTHIHTWLLKRPELWLYRPMLATWCLCFLIHCLGYVYMCLIIILELSKTGC